MMRQLPDSRSGFRVRANASRFLVDILRRAGAYAQDFFTSHPDVMSYGLVCLAAFSGLLALDKLERVPTLTVYVGSAFLLIALPALLVWRHRQQQAAVVRRIRALYAMAEAMIANGRRDEAATMLASIERWERHWRLGNSTLYRIAYSAALVASTFSVAAVHYVAYIHEYSRLGYGQQPHETLMQTVDELTRKPVDLYWVLGLSVVAAIAAAG